MKKIFSLLCFCVIFVQFNLHGIDCAHEKCTVTALLVHYFFVNVHVSVSKHTLRINVIFIEKPPFHYFLDGKCTVSCVCITDKYQVDKKKTPYTVLFGGLLYSEHTPKSWLAVEVVRLNCCSRYFPRKAAKPATTAISIQAARVMQVNTGFDRRHLVTLGITNETKAEEKQRHGDVRSVSRHFRILLLHVLYVSIY